MITLGDHPKINLIWRSGTLALGGPHNTGALVIKL